MLDLIATATSVSIVVDAQTDFAYNCLYTALYKREYVLYLIGVYTNLNTST